MADSNAAKIGSGIFQYLYVLHYQIIAHTGVNIHWCPGLPLSHGAGTQHFPFVFRQGRRTANLTNDTGTNAGIACSCGDIVYDLPGKSGGCDLPI